MNAHEFHSDSISRGGTVPGTAADQKEDGMEEQKVYTSAPTSGPFLRLVLLMASRKAQRANEAFECGASKETVVSGATAPFDETRDLSACTETFRRVAARPEAQLVRSHPISLAFLTLILTLHRQTGSDGVHCPEYPLRAKLTPTVVETTGPLTRSGMETAASQCRAPVAARDVWR